eukprot:g17041.t1
MRFLFFLSAWHLWGATGEGLCQETESAMEYDEDILVDSMNTELLQVKLELSKNQLDTVETTTTDADGSPTDDGTNTALLLKTCEDHCKFVGSAMWQYDPDCGGCKTSLMQNYAAQTPGVCASWAVSSSQVCQDYCTYMGSVLWQYDPECQGCKPSLLTKKECKNYCKHEPSEVWSYDASCQGCTPTLMESEEGECQEHCRQIGPVLWHKVSGCDSCKSSLLQTWAKAEAGCGQSLLKVNATTKCSSWTGGTCIFSNCDASRGPTQCNWAKACTCPQNFCANDQGICIFDLASVWLTHVDFGGFCCKRCHSTFVRNEPSAHGAKCQKQKVSGVPKADPVAPKDPLPEATSKNALRAARRSWWEEVPKKDLRNVSWRLGFSLTVAYFLVSMGLALNMEKERWHDGIRSLLWVLVCGQLGILGTWLSFATIPWEMVLEVGGAVPIGSGHAAGQPKRTNAKIERKLGYWEQRVRGAKRCATTSLQARLLRVW